MCLVGSLILLRNLQLLLAYRLLIGFHTSDKCGKLKLGNYQEYYHNSRQLSNNPYLLRMRIYQSWSAGGWRYWELLYLLYLFYHLGPIPLLDRELPSLAIYLPVPGELWIDVCKFSGTQDLFEWPPCNLQVLYDIPLLQCMMLLY